MIVGALVYNSSHKKSSSQSINLTNTKSSQPKSNSSSSQSKSSSSSSGAKTSTGSSSSANGSSTSGSTTHSTSSSSTTQPATSPTSSPAPTTSETPLSALTSVISSLDAGNQANVTASNVSIPGPISTASGRPLVFSVGGKTYFAYTQGSKPNFNTSASQTAGTMAIVNASGSYTLTSAYLDKAAILVDSNQVAVGYSTGGD